MFHWQDNVYFGRMQNGSVRVLKFPSGYEQGGWKSGFPNADGEYPNVIVDLIIPDNHWGSIVASVSHAGEENGRWYQAMDFHNGTSTGAQSG